MVRVKAAWSGKKREEPPRAGRGVKWTRNMGSLLVGVLMLLGMNACEGIPRQGPATGLPEGRGTAEGDGPPPYMEQRPADAGEPEVSPQEPDTAGKPSERASKTGADKGGSSEKTASAEGASLPRSGIFTAYTSQPSQTDGTPFISADGTDLDTVKGCVVANNYFPFGTRIRVESIGECVVRDRGADGHPSYWFDIYMGRDHDRAEAFGRKTLNYKVLP